MKIYFCALLLVMLISLTRPAEADGFPLVRGGAAANLWVGPQDAEVVRIAAGCLAGDIQQVTGTRPAVRQNASGLSGNAVLIGTLGSSPLIDKLAAQGKLRAQTIHGQWETFLIATVVSPVPGVKRALVIAGSDRRGTAFGVFTLSRQIGVSPWAWWADVKPRHQTTLTVPGTAVQEGPPSVKYRGIFLNDEDWGLRPWASKTFDPQTGNIGPKTYAKVFELLLRLKANFLWPAMHPGTTPFNAIPQNKTLADNYGIVMGSSHAEPMLRNNVGEWKPTDGDYNYATNAAHIQAYWQQRLRENGRYENVYTVGIRGIHDSTMQGPKDTPSRVALLQQVMSDQRKMLTDIVNPDLAQVPQIFANYKEVLTLYEAGLQVPNDVTLLWADDNFGYITRLSSAAEQKRPGGAGVYYHVSYWGAPEDYLWLCTTPPALIWEEMTKAYDSGARTVWVVNVGDLKPAERETEFFLSLAWNRPHWTVNSLPGFTRAWAVAQFGPAHAQAIASILNMYDHLASARKPEHMDSAGFSSVAYGDEAQQRLDIYARLAADADTLAAQMPQELQDAYFELVQYPVRCAALQNQKFLEQQKAQLYARQGRASAPDAARAAQTAYDQIQAQTASYNDKVAHGKWHGMVSAAPRAQKAFLAPAPLPAQAAGAPGFGAAVEGLPDAVGSAGAALPEFSTLTRERHFIDVFRTGADSADWTAQTSTDWIVLSATHGMLGPDARVWVSINWAKAPHGERAPGQIVLRGSGTEKTITLTVFNPASLPGGITGFAESGGAIALDAGHWTRQIDRNGAGWRIVPGLGRTGHAVTVLPTTIASITDTAAIAARAPELDYAVRFVRSGPVTITVYAVPTWPLSSDHGSRIALAFDSDPPQSVDLKQDKAHWAVNVLRGVSLTTVSQSVSHPGPHTLHVWMADPGVVLDRIVIDTGGVQPSALGPPETLFSQEPFRKQ